MKLLSLRPFLAALMAKACPVVGGQAVMEGVMMRHQSHYALAVRHADGSIVAERKPWFSLTTHPLLKKRFLRGFPVLLETLVNGIKALNRSAEQAAQGENEKLETWHIVVTMLVAFGMAIILFVVVPHLLSIVMQWLGVGGDVQALSFHLWDGLFKCAIFVGYILAISLLPDIRRVFQYHGAEHKVIHTFENGGEVTAYEASRMSRLHPRCGTTFLLFVICISIVLHAILVPLLLLIWTPENVILKHTVTIFFKLILMIPIAALAYELIHAASRMGDTLLGRILRTPGLVLQKLTTYEPHYDQLEVAIVALYEALGDDAPENIRPVDYKPMPE